jgi:hypothetical protein
MLYIAQAIAYLIYHLVWSLIALNQLYISRVLLNNIKKALKLKKYINLKDKLLKYY